MSVGADLGRSSNVFPTSKRPPVRMSGGPVDVRRMFWMSEYDICQTSVGLPCVMWETFNKQDSCLLYNPTMFLEQLFSSSIPLWLLQCNWWRIKWLIVKINRHLLKLENKLRRVGFKLSIKFIDSTLMCRSGLRNLFEILPKTKKFKRAVFKMGIWCIGSILFRSRLRKPFEILPKIENFFSSSHFNVFFLIEKY
jgi:hypothetical protein